MTSEEIAQRVRAAGVVGAGGAGFPTHVKLAARNIDTVIANGAECEPMLRCDQQLMAAHPELVIRGMRLVMQAVGAGRGLIAVKKHYASAVKALQAELDRQKDADDARAWPVSLYIIERSVYPAGDEFCLVYEVTGRLIPEAGLPLNVGCVVQNVGTLANIARAVDDGTPVTHRYVTINGEVKLPRTINAPLGMSFEKVIECAGGYARNESELKVVVGGPMTGHIVEDVKAETITKTTGGILVLPVENEVVRFMSRSLELWTRRGKASCDQCRDCTVLCPRHLLGHDFSPHEIMRSGAYGINVKSSILTSAIMCCECRLCEAYSCPLELSPMQFYKKIKSDLAASGWKNEVHHRADLTPDDFREGRLVPTERLVARLGVGTYHEWPVTWDESEVRADRVAISLKQHIGVPAQAVVAEGDMVSVGQLIAAPPEGKLGASIHASIAGRVSSIGDKTIVIEA